MEPQTYFKNQDLTNKKKYDALRAFLFEKRPAKEVAENYGYTISALYSLSRDFKKMLKESPNEDPFFKQEGKKKRESTSTDLDSLIIDLRKQNFSAQDIVGIVNAKDYKVSYGYVYNLLKSEGFARLHRRQVMEKKQLIPPKLKAPVAQQWDPVDEKFHSGATGVLAFLPIIKQYGIDKIIEGSSYPHTKQIGRLSSILSFVALKLSDVKRYSKDDMWCMDRGLGLFAGLNVLPKSAWLSSYSDRVTRDMNVAFLKELHEIWAENGLLSDTSNLDFTTIPYWGDNTHLENNWSGKRNKALESMLAVLAQDPDTGIIDYGNCDVLHKAQSSVVLEYLDFYKQSDVGKQNLKYLVFDSKFTNYENLSALDEKDIKFVTIRRRGKKILEQIREQTPDKTIRVEASGLKKRTMKVRDEKTTLRGYVDNETGQLKPIRQITITGHGKVKPALVITNDFDISVEKVVRKYCRRWIVEKGISEQIDFFHLNRVSSSMVIKVDFDLVMTILAHNLYRLLARKLGRYSTMSDERVYNKFIANNGTITIKDNNVSVELKKKRDLPQLIEMIQEFDQCSFSWLHDNSITFTPSATT